MANTPISTLPLLFFQDKRIRLAGLFLACLVLLFLFLVSIEMIGIAMESYAFRYGAKLLDIVIDPLASFCIGMLGTVIFQRSSTTTSLAVVAVSSGIIDLSAATFIIFGANLGTTLTSDLVALSHIFQKRSFTNAFATALTHDIFNLLTLLLLVPIELFFQGLSKTAAFIVSILPSLEGSSLPMLFPIKQWVRSVGKAISYSLDFPIIEVAISLVLLALTLYSFKRILRQMVMNESTQFFEKSFFRNDYRTFGWGILITSIIQSSSLTTSISTLYAGAQKISPRKLFPLIAGANIGTTLTAFLAALFLSPAALSVAIAHLLFNVAGILLFFPVPFMRSVPVRISLWMTKVIIKPRSLVFVYLIMLYFCLPFGLLYISQMDTYKKIRNANRAGVVQRAMPHDDSSKRLHKSEYFLFPLEKHTK